MSGFMAFQPTTSGMAMVRLKGDQERKCLACGHVFGPESDRAPLLMPGSRPGTSRLECEDCQPEVMLRGHL